MAVINSYSSYGASIIDATQLSNLSTTVNQIEAYAQKELQAAQFVTKLKGNIAASRVGGYASAGSAAVLDNLIEMMQLSRATAAEISGVQSAVAILKKYMDATTYPSAMANTRKIIASLATTLDGVTPAMMYSAIAA